MLAAFGPVWFACAPAPGEQEDTGTVTETLVPDDERTLWMFSPRTASDRDSVEKWDLFQEPDAWADTRAAIDSFGLFHGSVDTLQPFEQPLLDDVRVHIEAGGLRGFECDGTTFFETVDAPVFDQLVAGGHEDFIVSLDAPFTYTVTNGFHWQCAQLFAQGEDPTALGCDPTATLTCDHSIDDVARELVEYLTLFRARYPNASIGWIEPVPLLSYAEHPSEAPVLADVPFPDFAAILSAMDDATTAADVDGFEFFHADWYYTGVLVPVWQGTYDPWAKHEAIATDVRTRNLRFGVLLNDYREWLTDPFEKDALFHTSVLHYYDCFHAYGGWLDDVVVESWVPDFPTAIIPEDADHSFTRTLLDLAARMDDPAFTPTCDLEADIAALEEDLAQQ